MTWLNLTSIALDQFSQFSFVLLINLKVHSRRINDYFLVKLMLTAVMSFQFFQVAVSYCSTAAVEDSQQYSVSLSMVAT